MVCQLVVQIGNNIFKVMWEIAPVNVEELPSLLIAFPTLNYVVSLQLSCPRLLVFHFVRNSYHLHHNPGCRIECHEYLLIYILLFLLLSLSQAH